MSERVGLGLPVYNGERYLRDALDSVLGQSFGDFRLVICDNASTDATLEICEAYARADPRVSVMRSETNLGIAPNFARAFRHSEGEYFKWVVHDDVLDPTYLERCVEILDRDPGIVLAYPRTLLIDPDGQELACYIDRMNADEGAPAERLAHVLREFQLGHCGLGLVRRPVLARTRLIGPFESSDAVLMAELALLGRFCEHPEFLYRRRVHGESTFGSYSTPEAFVEKMKTGQRVRRALPRTRVWLELMRAVAAAPLPFAERLRCFRAATRGYRYWPYVRGELRGLLRLPARRR